MSGLVLKLGPHERIMINGVVVENGDRRARLNVLTPDAKAELDADPERVEAAFRVAMRESLERWVALAEDSVE